MKFAGRVVGAMLACAAMGLATPSCGSSDAAIGNAVEGSDVDGGGASGNTNTACGVDADCQARMPAATPAGCALAKCEVLQGKCTFLTVDRDGDGHATADCKATDGTSIVTGDDCDDADATTYPGAPDTCDGKNHTCTTSACKCVTGTNQCDGNNTQACQKDGTWTAPVACSEQTCVTATGTCQGECVAGKTQCSDNGVQTCTALGQWGPAQECANATCVDGACHGSCTAGETMCSGNSVLTCTANGTWSAPAECVNQVCSSGACQGICAPGQTQCSGNGVQTCQANGQWGATVACTNQACAGSYPSVACQGVCAPGQSKTCNPYPACNTSTVSCQNGNYAACPAPTKPTWNGQSVGSICSVGGGACMNAGTVVCSGTNAATCSAVAGTPVGPLDFRSTTAPNGSWDWNCDGSVTRQQNNVYYRAGSCISPGYVCVAKGGNSADACNYKTFYEAPCDNASAECGGGVWVVNCQYEDGVGCKSISSNYENIRCH